MWGDRRGASRRIAERRTVASARVRTRMSVFANTSVRVCRSRRRLPRSRSLFPGPSAGQGIREESQSTSAACAAKVIAGGAILRR
jgi:hypothetical protein